LIFVLISSQFGYGKPSKEIFEESLKIAGIEKEPYLSLHIGDDIEKDYLAARKCSIPSLLIQRKYDEKRLDGR